MKLMKYVPPIHHHFFKNLNDDASEKHINEDELLEESEIEDLEDLEGVDDDKSEVIQESRRSTRIQNKKLKK